MSRLLFCFGLGYTALALARTLRADGWQIAGTTRDPDKQARLEQEGIEVYAFERDRPLEQDPAVLEEWREALGRESREALG